MRVLLSLLALCGTAFSARGSSGSEAQLLNEEGLRYSSSGQFAAAVNSFAAEADLWRARGPDYRAHLAITLTNLGGAQMNAGQLNLSITTHRDAVSLTNAVFGRDDHAADAMIQYAAALIAADDYPEASKLLNEAQAIAPDSSTMLQYQAILSIRLGKAAEAEELLTRVSKSTQRADGYVSLETAVISANLADLYESAGKYDRAQSLLRQATGAFAREFNSTDPRRLALLAQQGSLYMRQNKFALAEDCIMSALRGLSQTGETLEIAVVENALALLFINSDRAQQAQPLLEHAVQIQRATRSIGNRRLAASLLNLGLCDARQHQYKPALENLRESLDLFRNALGDGHPETTKAQKAYAEVLRNERRASSSIAPAGSRG